MNISNVSSNSLIADVGKKNSPDYINNAKGNCIYTKGVFDILHFGHLALFSYLEKLRTEHNHLIVVGVTADAIVKMKKGKNRPINPECERLLQISLLPQVDYAYIHNETDYCSAIELFQPKIYVKGMDTAGLDKNEELLMAKNPEFKLMPKESRIIIFSDDGHISTSTIINRINNL